MKIECSFLTTEQLMDLQFDAFTFGFIDPVNG